MIIDGTSSVFVTGGTGFFGKALLRYWAAKDRRGESVPNVTVLSRDPERFARQNPKLAASRWLRMHKGDVCVLNSLPIGNAYSHVLHAATDSTLGPQLTPLQRYDQIVIGTRNMLDFAVSCEASRFLLTSSGAVYGPQPIHIKYVAEDWNGMPDPLEPANSYGVSKRVAEHLCSLYEKNHYLQTVIARCFAFVGPDLPLDVHFAIGNFIRDAIWREKIIVSGDGSPLRSYLDQKDLALWLLTLMESGKAGQAYNVGSDQAISIADLAHLVRDIIAPNKHVYIKSDPNDCKICNTYLPSIQKARSELALEVKVSLKDSIRETANHAIKSIGKCTL